MFNNGATSLPGRDHDKSDNEVDHIHGTGDRSAKPVRHNYQEIVHIVTPSYDFSQLFLEATQCELHTAKQAA